MATAAEKKALIFVSAVAILGSGARVWRLQPPSASNGTVHVASDQTPGRSTERKSSGKRRKNARSKSSPRRDSTSVVDLDRAPLRDIEALGILKPGVARLIVADRDSFGPFGSLYELQRVPYLNRSDLRSLAPRVTFSLLPRPKNAVMQKRADPEPGRRRRRTTQGVAP